VRTSFIFLATCLFLLSACSRSEESTVCRSEVDEEFLAAVSDELKDRNVDHTFSHGQLCYKSEERFEISRAIAFVQSYRKAVGAVINDKAMETKILNWLTATNKAFQITNYDDGRRFLIIFSKSEEEVDSIRETLALIEAGEDVSF
jgi:hypothetical protein